MLGGLSFPVARARAILYLSLVLLRSLKILHEWQVLRLDILSLRPRPEYLIIWSQFQDFRTSGLCLLKSNTYSVLSFDSIPP